MSGTSLTALLVGAWIAFVNFPGLRASLGLPESCWPEIVALGTVLVGSANCLWVRFRAA